jgi:hypothetical protein
LGFRLDAAAPDVRFCPFGELVDRTSRLTTADLAVRASMMIPSKESLRMVVTPLGSQ